MPSHHHLARGGPGLSLQRTATNDTVSSVSSVASKQGDVVIDDPRKLAGGPRTPLPTPGELEALARTGALGVINWRKMLSWRTYMRKDWIIYYIIFLIILASTVLVTIFHTKIVNALHPFAAKLLDIPAGWLIPIAILFVISFPPLFGHEIVAILCGLIWGLWVGFAIVAAGTVLGEIGNFYAFRYCCHAHSRKAEKGSIFYAMLIRVIREGGFTIALAARLSIIPGHLTTAIFATCGMPILVFTLAAILSMPKQFIIVYLGVILEQASENNDQATSTRNSRISLAVFGATALITIFAAWYILYRMSQVKESVIYERRKARQRAIKVDLIIQRSRSSFSKFSPRNSLTASRSDMPYTNEEKIPNKSKPSALAIGRLDSIDLERGPPTAVTSKDIADRTPIRTFAHLSDEHLPSRSRAPQKPPGLANTEVGTYPNGETTPRSRPGLPSNPRRVH